MGVPQVPFVEDPEDDFDDLDDFGNEEVIEEPWVYLPVLLYEEGVFFLFEKIDNEVANNLISSILVLNDDEEIESLSLFLLQAASTSRDSPFMT